MTESNLKLALSMLHRSRIVSPTIPMLQETFFTKTKQFDKNYFKLSLQNYLTETAIVVTLVVMQKPELQI